MVAVALVALFAAACGGSALEVAPPTATAPPATEPPASPAVSRAVAAKPASPTLPDELFLAGPGGGGGGTAGCAALADQSQDVEWMASYGYGQLCLYGLPLDQPVFYDVFDAAGARVASGVTTSERVEGGRNTAEIDLVSKTYTPGRWTVVVETRSVDTVHVFDVTEEDTMPWVEMHLSTASSVVLDSSIGLSRGVTLGVHAAYAPPNAPVSLGIYRLVGEQGDTRAVKLVRSNTFESDEWGRVNGQAPITADFEPGTYFLALAVRPGYVPDTHRPDDERGAFEWITVK